MASVTQITQYLYQTDPQKSLVRLTLYHYLKNACDLSITFSSTLSIHFFDHCLGFLYWQEKQQALASELWHIIEELHSHGLTDDALEKYHWLKSVQVIAIQHEVERQKILESYFYQSTQDQKHRIVNFSNNQHLVMSLLASGGLRAQVFSPFFHIRQGRLIPLTAISDLEYTSYMELMPGRLQHLNLDNVRSAHFFLEESIYSGRVLHGHHFQTAGSIQTQEISAFQDIFYALKSLEKYFIDRKSDPFYNELIDQLEKAYHLLSSNNAYGFQIGPTILKKGQIALRNIFQKDKLLLLLVTNIEYMLNAHQAPKSQPESRPQLWQKAKPLPQ